jgi:predicted DNA-binding transcriptional regulator YafY
MKKNIQVHRNERLKALVNILLENSNISLASLLLKINQFLISKGWETVSERSLEGDIKALKSDEFGHEISCKRGKGYVISLGKKRLIDDEDGLVIEDFNKNDIIVLSQLKSVISQFKYLNFSDALGSVIEKIIENESMVKSREVKENTVVVFETNPISEDDVFKENYSMCLNAIIKKRKIRLEFLDFVKDEEDEYLLSPIQLRQYKHRWYLFAINHSRGDQLYNIAIDRVLSVEILEEEVLKDYISEIEKHFLCIVGVTNFKNNQIEKVQLKIDFPRAKYVQNKPLHPNQKEIKNTENYIIFEYMLSKNNELIAEILMLGKDVEVLKPLTLRTEIMGIFTAAAYRNK